MVEYFALKTKQKSKKFNCACRIVAVGLSPTLDYIEIFKICIEIVKKSYRNPKNSIKNPTEILKNCMKFLRGYP